MCSDFPLTVKQVRDAGFREKEKGVFLREISCDRVLQLTCIEQSDSIPHLWLCDNFTTTYGEYVFLSHPTNEEKLYDIVNALI